MTLEEKAISWLGSRYDDLTEDQLAEFLIVSKKIFTEYPDDTLARVGRRVITRPQAAVRREACLKTIYDLITGREKLEQVGNSYQHAADEYETCKAATKAAALVGVRLQMSENELAKILKIERNTIRLAIGKINSRPKNN